MTKGAPDKGGFLALYERDGRAAAVLSVDRPPPFMRARRELARGASAVKAAAASR
nr:oxidoreductase C-terminal domain-containing protein [Streptomyces ureilyticus]